jgi:hypothetical protein
MMPLSREALRSAVHVLQGVMLVYLAVRPFHAARRLVRVATPATAGDGTG